MNRSIFILLFLLTSCTQNQQVENEISDSSDRNVRKDTAEFKGAETESARLISCNGIGNIKLSDDMLSLVKKVGQENISADSIFLEGS